MIEKDKKILIIGLGLIGGSYAKGLKKRGYHVAAITRRQQTIDYALGHGIIDEGSAGLDPDLIGKADLVIFGLYPHTMIEWIRENQKLFKPGALLTDVSGIKCGVVDVVQGFLRDDLEFIGSHPMAGKEVYGIENSDDHIFVDANFIITPTEKNTQEAIDMIEKLAILLRFDHVSILSIQEHDEMIGFVSQLTHAVAVSLMNANDNTHLKDYTGDSFRDLTRIARINEEMWSELFFMNKKNLVREIDDFVAALEKLKDCIKQENKAEICRLFIQSTERRKYFDK